MRTYVTEFAVEYTDGELVNYFTEAELKAYFPELTREQIAGKELVENKFVITRTRYTI